MKPSAANDIVYHGDPRGRRLGTPDASNLSFSQSHRASGGGAPWELALDFRRPRLISPVDVLSSLSLPGRSARDELEASGAPEAFLYGLLPLYDD